MDVVESFLWVPSAGWRDAPALEVRLNVLVGRTEDDLPGVLRRQEQEDEGLAERKWPAVVDIEAEVLQFLEDAAHLWLRIEVSGDVLEEKSLRPSQTVL